MQLLAIDTTGDICSCALLRDGEISESSANVPRAHTRHLLPMIEELLASQNLGLSALDAIAFAAGPGSFTGVRIAASMAQGLAMAAGVQAVPVSSLAALAQAAVETVSARRILACTDARMGEVYAGYFAYRQDGGLRSCGPEEVVAPTQLSAPLDDAMDPAQPLIGVGSGFASYREALSIRIGRDLGQSLGATHPSIVAGAAQVARLAPAAMARGDATKGEWVAPRYLRNSVARTLQERQNDANNAQ